MGWRARPCSVGLRITLDSRAGAGFRHKHWHRALIPPQGRQAQEIVRRFSCAIASLRLWGSDMASDKSSVVLHMCFELDQENEVCRSLIVHSDKAAVDEWKKSKRSDNYEMGGSARDTNELASSNTDKEGPQDQNEPFVELSKLMTRFQETMSAYVPLRHLVLDFMPTLRSAFIYSEMYKSAARIFEIEETDEDFETYAVTKDQYPAILRQVRRLRELDQGTRVLPGAILLSLVATFDSFIADTLRIMLRLRPERLLGSSKTIEVSDILSMSSFDDVIDRITQDEVESIMRRSHIEQIKYLEDRLDVSIRSDYDEWGDFVEVFERRNLIAHGSYTINSHYIRNCSRNGFQVGAEEEGRTIELLPPYLTSSSNRLLEFGLSLMFVLWLKHFPETREAAYENLNRRTYELIRDGQPQVASRLLDLALFRQSPKASERTVKMMTVNLANAYKKSENQEKSYQVLDGVDWSATTDDFQICIAAIREDIDRVVELMPRVNRQGSIGMSQFREWPVFDWIRDEMVVRQKFEEVFGEPINAASDGVGSNSGDGGGIPDGQGGGTVH